MLLMARPFMTIDATHVLRVNVILSGPFTDRHVALMEGVWSSLWVSLPGPWRVETLILAFVPGVLWFVSFRPAAGRGPLGRRTIYPRHMYKSTR